MMEENETAFPIILDEPTNEAIVSLDEIVSKISVGKHRDKVFIAKEYTIADLISDLKNFQHQTRVVNTSRMDPAPKQGYCNTSLFDDEPTNIYDDISNTMGKDYAIQWLQEPNTRLSGETPHKMIRSGEAYRVRQILRGIKYVGIS